MILSRSRDEGYATFDKTCILEDGSKSLVKDMKRSDYPMANVPDTCLSLISFDSFIRMFERTDTDEKFCLYLHFPSTLKFSSSDATQLSFTLNNVGEDESAFSKNDRIIQLIEMFDEKYAVYVKTTHMLEPDERALVSELVERDLIGDFVITIEDGDSLNEQSESYWKSLYKMFSSVKTLRVVDATIYEHTIFEPVHFSGLRAMRKICTKILLEP